MGTMPDQEIVEKSLEIKKHAQRISELSRELAIAGCRVEIDTTDYQRIDGTLWPSVVTVDVYRRIA